MYKQQFFYRSPRGAWKDIASTEEEPDYTKNEHTSISHEDQPIKTSQEGEHGGLKKEVTITIQEELTMTTATTHKQELDCTKLYLSECELVNKLGLSI